MTPDSVLSLCPLSVVSEGEEFSVGCAATGTYVTIPEVGVTVIRELDRGLTIRQVTDLLAGQGVDVDVLDFAATLLECGFVAAVDGVATGVQSAQAPARGLMAWLERIRPEAVRPLFSRTAWTIYGAALLFCTGVFLTEPRYWPSFQDFFFLPDPAVSSLIVGVTGLVLAGVHELWHWLAARAEGVSARFRVSRRLFLLVFETDVSALWGIPRHRRYGAFLAGMAFDVTTLAACLAVRMLSGLQAIDVPLLNGFAGALVLTRVTGLAFQTLVFLRTDLYAALVTGLGCANLYRVTYLYLVRRVRRLTAAEAAEWAGAGARDLAVVRWFAWLYAIGLGVAAYFFVRFFIPGTVKMGGWLIHSLAGADVTRAAFWEALVLGALFLFQNLTPLVLFLRERLSRYLSGGRPLRGNAGLFAPGKR